RAGATAGVAVLVVPDRPAPGRPGHVGPHVPAGGAGDRREDARHADPRGGLHPDRRGGRDRRRGGRRGAARHRGRPPDLQRRGDGHLDARLLAGAAAHPVVRRDAGVAARGRGRRADEHRAARGDARRGLHGAGAADDPRQPARGAGAGLHPHRAAPPRTVIVKHGLRNAFIPVLTVISLQFGALLGGAVLTETVFGWPGIGRLLVDSINARDFPVVQGLVLVYALLFVLLNVFVDVL